MECSASSSAQGDSPLSTSLPSWVLKHMSPNQNADRLSKSLCGEDVTSDGSSACVTSWKSHRKSELSSTPLRPSELAPPRLLKHPLSDVSLSTIASSIADEDESQTSNSELKNLKESSKLFTALMKQLPNVVESKVSVGISPDVRREAEDIIKACLRNLSCLVEKTDKKPSMTNENEAPEAEDSSCREEVSMSIASKDSCLALDRTVDSEDKESQDNCSSRATYVLTQETAEEGEVVDSFRRLSRSQYEEELLNTTSPLPEHGRRPAFCQERRNLLLDDSDATVEIAEGMDRSWRWISDVLEAQIQAQVLRNRNSFENQLRALKKSHAEEIQELHSRYSQKGRDYQRIIIGLERQLSRAARDFIRLNDRREGEIQVLRNERDSLHQENNELSSRQLRWDEEQSNLRHRHASQLRQLADGTSIRLAEIQETFHQQIADMMAHIQFLKRENELLERRLEEHKRVLAETGLRTASRISVEESPVVKDQGINTEERPEPPSRKRSSVVCYEDPEDSGRGSSGVTPPNANARRSSGLRQPLKDITPKEIRKEQENQPLSEHEAMTSETISMTSTPRRSHQPRSALDQSDLGKEDATAIAARLSQQLHLLESTLKRSAIGGPLPVNFHQKPPSPLSKEEASPAS